MANNLDYWGSNVAWGNRAVAQLYGSDAGADGSYPLGFTLASMQGEPEALETPMGNHSDVILYNNPHGYPNIGQGTDSEGNLLPPVAPAPGEGSPTREEITGRRSFFGIPLPGQEMLEEAGSRIGWGSLGMLLVIVGILAFVLKSQSFITVGGE